jgi:hypothetical protein
MRPDVTPADHIFANLHDAEQALIDQGFRIEPDRGIGNGSFGWLHADGTKAGIYSAGKESWDPECRIAYVAPATAEPTDTPAASVETYKPVAVILVAIGISTMLPLAVVAAYARLAPSLDEHTAIIVHYAPESAR